MKLLRSYPEGFLEETERESRPALRVGSGVGALALSSFFLVDLLLVPKELWVTAFTIRALCWLVLSAIFVVTFLPMWKETWARPAAWVSFWVTGGGVIAVTALAGGGASRYHEALLLTNIGWSSLRIPWKRWEPPINFVLLCMAYDLVMVAGDLRGPVVVWATNNAMLWLGALIATALSELLTRQRTQDFLFRRELAENTTRLAEVDRAKSRFFANLSHELRTPISLTVAPVEVMLEGQGGRLDAGQRETLQLVRRNGLRLLKMMDDLLALTLAEVGNLRLRMELLDVGQLAHGLRMDLQQFVELKRLNLHIEVAEGVVPVIGDAELIERVLVTFLGNSAKFSESGGEIRLAVNPAEHGGVLITVSDTGMGIPAEELPRIFEPFYHGKRESGGRPGGGAGVGLALAKAVVELHGGTLDVESTEGEGTTIRMTIPPHPPESAPVERRRRGMELVAGGGRGIETGLPEWHATFRTTSDYRLQALRDVTERPVQRSTNFAPAAAPRVLIVEDNPDMTRFLETILASQYRTLTATDAAEGARLAVSQLPDIVVTDLEMPGRNGMDLVRDLRADPRTANLPIVMLASSDAASHRAPEGAEKPDAYVPKPFKVIDLTGAINALVQQQERGRSASMAERDEALVYMATGIADVASTALEALSADDAKPASAQASLTDLVSSLQSFVRPLDSSAVVERSLTPLVREAIGELESVRFMSRSNAQVRVEPDDFISLLRLLVRIGLEGGAPGSTVAVEVTEDASGTAMVAIRDGGPSLPPEHALRLFYPFNDAVDPDVSTALAGYRRRIERLRGRLTMEHGDGEASAFVIRLPAVRPFGKT